MDDQSNVLNRREFVKLLGLAAGSLLAAPALVAFTPPPGIAPPGSAQPGLGVRRQFVRLYRAGPAGQISASDDGGRTWAALVDFGGELRVREVAQKGDELRAVIECDAGEFELSSPNGRAWYTAGYRRP